MTDLQRWLDAEQAPRGALELLSLAQPPSALDAATRARSRRHLVAMTALPAAAGMMFWLKSVALGAVLGSAVTVAIVVPNWRAQPTAKNTATAATGTHAARQAQTAVPVGAVTTDVAVASSAATQSASASAPSTTKAMPSTTVNSTDDLGREIQLLERARQLLDKDPSRALSTLDEHKREFGNGTLVLERQFLEVEALVRLGRRDEARAKAAALRARAPGSLYEHRLGKLLDAENE